MKFVTVVATEGYLINNPKYIESELKFNSEDAILYGRGDLIAWFPDQNFARELLTMNGYDDMDISAMQFVEIDYVPNSPGEIRAAVIYDLTGMVYTTLGEDLSSQNIIEEMIVIKSRLENEEVLTEVEGVIPEVKIPVDLLDM